MAARKLESLIILSASPGYFDSVIAVVLAQDLYPSRLPGDEPEVIEVVEWRSANYPSLSPVVKFLKRVLLLL